jgi:hypothetical protein
MLARIQNYLTKSFFERIFTIGVVVLLVCLFADAVGSGMFTAKLFGVYAYELVLPVLAVLIFYRWKRGVFLGRLAHRLLSVLAFFLFFIAPTLTMYDALSPANTVYALTRMHHAQLLLIAAVTVVIVVLDETNEWWKQKWKNVLFAFPFVCLYFLLLTRFLPFDIFLELVKEDNLVEYFQFIVLVAGAIISCGLSFIWQKKNIYWAVFFGLCAVALFLVAGDEVAWGQRFFNIATGNAVKNLNRQNEITFHNLRAVDWAVVYGYVTISVWGVYARLLTVKAKRLARFKTITPSPLLLGYFLFPAVYFMAQVIATKGVWHAWSEVAELYLYTGVVLWVGMLGKGLKRKSL